MESYLVEPKVLSAAVEWPRGVKGLVAHLCRYTKEEADRMLSIFQTEPAQFWIDPYETDPQYSDLISEVDKLVDSEIPLTRGSCHRRWRRKKELLRERGLLWLSPSDLNPYVRFD